MKRSILLMTTLLACCNAFAADLACSGTDLVVAASNPVVGRLSLDCRLFASVDDTSFAYVTATDAVILGSNAMIESGFANVTPGKEYFLIKNDGSLPVSGIFPGYPEGQVFTTTFGGDFRLSYRGGDGNDVTVTALAPAKAWTGNAGNLLLSDGGNWSPSGPLQSGDRILVPDNVVATLVNDLPPSFTFGGIRGGHYSGTAFSVSGYIRGATFSSPVDVQGRTVVITAATFGGPISGSGMITATPVDPLVLQGAGTFTGTFLGPGPLGGILQMQSSQYPSASTVNMKLAGTGAIGNAEVRWIDTAGTITTAALTLDRKISWLTPQLASGTSNPRVIATGPITLGGFLLVSSSDFTSSQPGEQFMLIRNDGASPVTGTFRGMPEGTVISLDGAFHRLSYRGGDGNDVTLTGMDRIMPRMTAGRARDFNADGRRDLAWRHSSGAAGAWLMSGLTIVDARGVMGPTGAVPFGLGDFNGDGRTDFLWRAQDGSFYISLMAGLSSAGAQRILQGGLGWEVIGIGDFNGDGQSDLLWRHSSGQYGVWLMSGTTPTSVAALPQRPTGYWIDALGDFDGDGRTDLLWRDANGNATTWSMNGTSVTASHVLLSGKSNATYWSASLVADFDGDGIDDIASWDVTGKTTLWLMSGGAISTQATLIGEDTGWYPTFAGDLDGDHKADLVWASTDGSQGAWLMNGATTKSYGLLIGGGSGWHVAGLADIDGNGTADLLWRHDDGSHGAWLMQGLQATSYGVFFGAGSGWELMP